MPPQARVGQREAQHVHAILAQNAAHYGRPRKHNRDTLLHGGLVYCGYCRGRMDPMRFGRKRKDGTRPLYYRCNEQINHGRLRCQGTNIRADTLDHATRATLDENLAHGHFLDNLFAAWEADETVSTQAGPHRPGRAGRRQGQPGEPRRRFRAAGAGHSAWAAFQVQIDQLNALLPGLEDKVAKAQADAAKVRGNAALRDELKEWFAAWMMGFWELSVERQRQFLFAVHARVNVWRESDRTPRAELVIGLPTDALVLPPPMPPDLAALEATVASDGSWHIPLDTDRGARIAAFAREQDEPEPETPERAERQRAWDNTTASGVMAAVEREMRNQGGNPPKATTTSSISR